MSGNGAEAEASPPCAAFFLADGVRFADLPYMCELDPDHDGLHAAPSVDKVEARTS